MTLPPARRQNAQLPQMNGQLFLTYVGAETDLIFNQNVDLPGFATFPLLETDAGRTLLKGYMNTLIEEARKAGAGVVLESPTWVANRDRGAAIGYSPETLRDRNIQAIDLMTGIRADNDDIAVVISANVGPRADAYAPSDLMTAREAEAYHGDQIGALAQTQVDLISGYTIADVQEAIGIVRAARRHDLPVIIAFTVETDGRLPTGLPLREAVQAVDEATDMYAAYFMVNCAHPDHIAPTLTSEPWLLRLRGIVANASRCSHAELDEATELDSGNPEEFGALLARIARAYPHINILGGCCGTDMRHIRQIAVALRAG